MARATPNATSPELSPWDRFYNDEIDIATAKRLLADRRQILRKELSIFAVFGATGWLILSLFGIQKDN